MLHLKAFLNKLLFSLGIGHKISENFKQETKKIEESSKINFSAIQELLLVQYSERILETLEKELKASYELFRAHESTLIAHSKEHHAIIDTIQNINKDLQKLQLERIKLSQKNNSNMAKVKQDLEISDYHLKKPKK